MICECWLIQTSGMVLVREILAGLPSDILAGLGTSTSVPHDVVRNLTALAAIGGLHSHSSQCDLNASNQGLMMRVRLSYLATLWCMSFPNDQPVNFKTTLAGEFP